MVQFTTGTWVEEDQAYSRCRMICLLHDPPPPPRKISLIPISQNHSPFASKRLITTNSLNSLNLPFVYRFSDSITVGIIPSGKYGDFLKFGSKVWKCKSPGITAFLEKK